MEQLLSMLKMDFLSGYKTYIVLGLGILVLAASLLTNTNILCEVSGADVCEPLDKQATIKELWATVAGVFIRKGIPKTA